MENLSSGICWGREFTAQAGRDQSFDFAQDDGEQELTTKGTKEHIGKSGSILKLR
jgi:hypothetical protein